MNAGNNLCFYLKTTKKEFLNIFPISITTVRMVTSMYCWPRLSSAVKNFYCRVLIVNFTSVSLVHQSVLFNTFCLHSAQRSPWHQSSWPLQNDRSGQPSHHCHHRLRYKIDGSSGCAWHVGGSRHHLHLQTKPSPCNSNRYGRHLFYSSL